MQSKATTVKAYLAELPAERREALEEVRRVILNNLDKDYAEGMSYGMIGYYVPHSVYPAGYHCDPKQPLPFAGLASQKNHMSLYMMCIYGEGGHAERFRKEWAKTGKKLDMGKACIRFKKAEDLALDVIGDTFKRITAKKYIEHIERAWKRDGRGTDGKRAPASKKPATSAGKTGKKASVTKKAGSKRGN